ncbi:MAG: OadG family protein [SAR324 cluster bacterium]|nr:OadG family protein [SAR324 cluster bacterium]
MFSAGLKLMVVGMLMVLLFLLLMMLFIMLIEFLNRSHTKMEAQRIQQERKAQKQYAFQVPKIPAAVLAAAVSAYEAERQKLFIT